MASERWKNDVAYAMTPFKLLTWPIGLWPLQVYNIFSLIRCVLATCCLSTIVILPSMEFHLGCTNTEQNIDSLMLACCGLLGVFKIICFRIYAKNLTNNYSSARNDYLTIKNAEYRAIMRKHAFMGRILSCFMVCFAYISVVIYSLMPLLGEDLVDYQDNQINKTNEDIVLEYPMPSRCALEYLHVPRSMYEFICIFEFIALILTSTCNHGNDSLFLHITLHLCGQVKILKADFFNFVVSSPQVYDRFNDLIRRHNYLMELAKELTETISIVLLTQLFISSILLCIMGKYCIYNIINIIVILPSMEFHMGCTNTEQNIDGLMLACCGVLGVFKTICFRIYAKNLTDNYSSARNDYLTIKNIEYRAIMRKHAFMGRILSCFMVCFSYISVTIYSLIPLLGENLVDDQDVQINRTNEDIVLDYPMPSRCALEYLHVPRSMHEFICIFEFIVLVLTCTCNHGNDSLFLNITLHMCGQVKILKANFVNFVVSSPQVYDRFNDLIRRHNYLIELAKELTESISIVLLTQLFISSILLCIMGFQFILALKTHNVVVMGKSAMVLCTFLTQLSIYSFIGDHLKSQMEEIGFFIYQSNWLVSAEGLDAYRRNNLLRGKSKPSTRTISGHAGLQFFFLGSKPTNTSPNMKTNWNSGIDYGFSTIKSMMWILGLWPLQQDNVVYTIQWFIIFITGSLTMINVLIESFKSCDAVRDGLDILRLIESCMHAWSNIVFPRIYMKKIAINVNSAIDDWSSPSMKKESRMMMMGYARAGRLIALTQLIAGATAGALWFISVFLSNKQEAAIIDNDTVATWNFVIPSTCLYKGVSYSTYKILFMMQVVQGSLILISECACDSFFFGITMHLCGQLELLGIEFTEINKKHYDKKRHRNVLGPLVRRHCQLIALTRNIEDTFNINILLRFLIISVVIASSGVGILLSIKQQDYKEMIKMFMSIQFYMVQTFLYTYAGDTLKNRSESIVYAIYSTAWDEMSPVMVKDLIFIMMRMKTPLRIMHLSLTTIMSSNDDIAYAMTLVKHLTVPIGAWPLQEYNKFALLRHILSSFGLSVVVIVQYLELYYNCTSATANLDALTIFTCGILALTKITWFRIYADNLICNYSSAMNDYVTIDTEKKRIIMRNHAFWGRIICIIALLISYVDSVIFIVGHAKLSSEEAKINITILGHQAGYAIPSTCSDSVFLHIVLHVCGQLEILKANFINFDVTSNDILLLGIILHICGQMELLKIEFTNYNGENKDMKEFEALASRHCYLMEHAELLIDVISFVLLVQLLFSCLIICLVGFQLILALKLHDAVIITKTTSVLSALLLQLFSYSFVGDYLKRQMEDIAHSIYCCNWYYFPLKLMRNVLFRTFPMIDSYYRDTRTGIMKLLCNAQLYLTAIMTWNDDIAYAMTPFKLLTLPLGVWPLQKYNTFALIRSIISGSSLTGMMIMLFLEIIFGSSDAYVKLDALMLMFCNVLSVLKLLSFRIYANNMIRNFTSAINDYLAIDNNKKHAIMRQHAFIGRMISYSILFFAYLASTIFCSDSLFLAITTHLCGQMEILKMEFVNYGVESKNIFEDFSKLASRHHYLMEHAELLVEVISFVLLVQMLFSCLIICLIASSIFTLAPMITGDENVHVNVSIKNQAAKLPVPITFLGDLQIPSSLYFIISSVQYFILLLTGTSNCGFQFILALKSHDIVMITKTISVLSGLLLQLFFYSFVGDYMKCQVEQIAHSIYSSNWYYLPTKLMRNILLVIMRSQQPVQLLAASSIFTLAPMMTDDEDIYINVSIKNQAAKLPVPITFLGDLRIPTGLFFVISTVQYFILLLTGTSNCGNKLTVNIKEICI
ncbi:Putative odorant receptor 22c [Trachymyrmex septentrionalis]|uniref:Putative odorant receptor 22c n=1 Tax=Trachymyrmex septentrionalis TaxID=34720 RepID=A0A195FFK9_9HYME|nr:Putative odorant receptor 22c [Trachymyrmex septentrionalis]